MKNLFSIILVSASILFSSCNKDKSERKIALEDYQQNYLGSIVDDPGWTGNISTCDAGSISQNALDKTLIRINYFRRLVGLNDNITFNSDYFDMHQQAALMMDANNQLSHHPPSNWLCWTADGDYAAGTSSISLGSVNFHSSRCITLFIEDPGSSNTAVGHRRWLLYSRASEFSFGCTNRASALTEFGDAAKFENTNFPEYIAYPPNGYIPQELVFERWSFSIPAENNQSADFSNAQISMSGPDGDINLNVVSRTDNGYGDNTIVWEPQNVLTSSNEDIEYFVTITDIENNSIGNYSYSVKIFKP